MGAPEESLNEQDPDYVSVTSNDKVQQKIYEENARSTTARKITSIIEKQFSREIDSKEKEILQIQEKLHKALKTLHLLRYVIITDFYNRKQCQIPQAAETTKQTRIHPAVKSLLGKSPKSAYCTDLAVPSTSSDPRYLCNNESLASVLDTRIPENNKFDETVEKCNIASQAEKRSLQDEESRPRKIPRYVPPKSSMAENTCPSRGIRHKTRKRIIVGNISKWIPPDWREDAASHKWTMYVRGDKDDADISTFVSKVRFFLHPSYRPNDVVEVTSSPFYLSRRGWGEFPLRVQLHFKNALNKPMDIIHHLKLDRTYTGLQTLGSETLVDVWIHAADSRNLDQSSNGSIESSAVDDTFNEIETNSSSDPELSEQTLKSEEILEYSEKVWPIASTSQVHLKKEITNTEIYEIPSLPIDSNIIQDCLENIKIKLEPDDAISKSNTYLYSKLDELSLEQIRYCINRDHDYLGKQYSSSCKRTVKEGNVTIEHFPENGYASVTNSLIDNNNKEKHDSATIISYKYNGDIQSSTNYQTLNVANVENEINDNLKMFRVSSEQIGFQQSDDHGVIKSLAANNSEQSKSSMLHDITKLPLEDSDTLSTTLDNVENRIKKEKDDNIVPTSDNIAMQDISTTINGIYKSSDSFIERLNNLQKTVMSSNNRASHLKPLHISIPPLFASSHSKRMLLMKDKKLIPVDVTNISPSNLNEDSMKIADSDVKVPTTRHSNATKLNVTVPHCVSILKKPFANNAKINTRQENLINKEATILTLKTSNSILLNINYNVPALKFADSRDARYNYNLTNTTKDMPLTDMQESCIKVEDKDEKIQKTKITLGKDKHKIQSKQELYEAILKTIETASIIDIESLIRFIIRRLPIITENARDPDYKRLHPYACCSEEDFFTHNPGKQRAFEWNRAKTIRYFLQKKLIPDNDLWSVKEIVVWARLHGYTPYRNSFSIATMNATNGTKKLPNSSASSILSSCTEPVAFQKWLQTCRQEANHRSTDDFNEIENTEIDIETIEEDSHKTINNRRDKGNSESLNNLALTPLELDRSLMPLHNFVCDSARDIGIKIGPEEIVPGVVYCAASRALMRVIECFVEDITRASLAKAWERNSDNGCPQIITLDDVRSAIVSREEFDIFTNEGLGSRQRLSTMD